MDTEQTPQLDNQEPAVEDKEKWYTPLTRVTPLSKYLAMALFIALPFGGFWLGVEYWKHYIYSADSSDSYKEFVEDKISDIKTESDKANNEIYSTTNATPTDLHIVPELQLTADNQHPLPGGTVTFTAQFNESDEFTSEVSEYLHGMRLSSKKGMNRFDDTYPYQWSISLLPTASGVDEYKATTLLGAEAIVSSNVTIIITPDMSTLDQIFFDPAYLWVLGVGDTVQLQVMGRFSDGYEREITEKELGTIYTENIVDGLTITAGDSPVIDVTEDGIVVGLQLGEAEVVATTHGISNVRRIIVAE